MALPCPRSVCSLSAGRMNVLKILRFAHERAGKRNRQVLAGGDQCRAAAQLAHSHAEQEILRRCHDLGGGLGYKLFFGEFTSTATS